MGEYCDYSPLAPKNLAMPPGTNKKKNLNKKVKILEEAFKNMTFADLIVNSTAVTEKKANLDYYLSFS